MVIENINLAGDFTAGGSSDSATVFRNIPTFNGGTMTIASGASVGIIGGNDDARIHLAGGALKTFGSSFTIEHLSGTGGVLGRASGVGGTRRTITLNQSENTVLNAPGFASSDLTFAKTGSGTFIVDNDTESDGVIRNLSVAQGGLYISNNLQVVGNTTVAAGAVFGGTFHYERPAGSGTLTLSAADSALAPGLPELDPNDNVVFRAGTLSIAEDFTAADGGTFNFYLDDDDGQGGVANSRIDFIGDGDLTLGGTKTVNLYGLGADLIETGVAYTLISIGEDIVKAAGWDVGWEVGENTTGYAVQSFGWNDNDLTVTLIPEPGTMVLLLGGLTTLWWVRKRRG